MRQVTLSVLALLSGGLMMGGCHTVSDDASMAAIRSNRSSDFIIAAREMARDIAGHVAARADSPRVLMGSCENLTGLPQYSFRPVVARLRHALQHAAPEHGFELVTSDRDDAPSADYVITCQIRDFRQFDARYYEIYYRVLERSPDGELEQARLVWENRREVVAD